MKNDYSDVAFSQGLVCLNTNNNTQCVVIDGNKGTDNDRCSLVLECSAQCGFFLHTPPNRALKPTGRICDIKRIVNEISKYVVIWDADEKGGMF